MSASTGMLGGARIQYLLRHILTVLNMHPINHPEVLVTYADEKIGEDGELPDQETKRSLRKLLGRLTARSEELRK